MSNLTVKPKYSPVIAIVLLLVSAGLAAAYELKADKVVVKKSERKMYLFMAGQVIGEFPISLGLNPIGHKQQQGEHAPFFCHARYRSCFCMSPSWCNMMAWSIFVTISTAGMMPSSGD